MKVGFLGKQNLIQIGKAGDIPKFLNGSIFIDKELSEIRYVTNAGIKVTKLIRSGVVTFHYEKSNVTPTNYSVHLASSIKQELFTDHDIELKRSCDCYIVNNDLDNFSKILSEKIVHNDDGSYTIKTLWGNFKADRGDILAVDGNLADGTKSIELVKRVDLNNTPVILY